jgi:periplasmic protein TonB
VSSSRISQLQQGRRRRRGIVLRLAISSVLGVAGSGVLLFTLAKVYADIEHQAPPHLVQELRVLDRPPPPLPPPPEPQIQPPPPPTPLALPALELAPPSVSASRIALPALEITVDAPTRLPLAVPGIRVTSAGTGMGGRQAQPAQRLVAPDLHRFYPRRYLRRHLEGRTMVRADIDADGRVGEVTILESEPEGLFDTAAIQAMRTIRYQPATDAQGQAVPGSVTETLIWRNPR